MKYCLTIETRMSSLGRVLTWDASSLLLLDLVVAKYVQVLGTETVTKEGRKKNTMSDMT